MENEINNKQKVVGMLKAIETGAREPIGYINAENYKQHNLGIGDGLQGIGELVQSLPPNSAKINTERVFQDGDFVFAHTVFNISAHTGAATRGDFFGVKVGFDIFRFENGKMVEHWDNLQEEAGPNPSGHTMIDGSTEVKDLERTEANKSLVQSFVQDILVGGQIDKLGSFMDGDNYIQHNPLIADGASGLRQAFETLAKQGVGFKYEKMHKVLGEGNFVLVVGEGVFAGKPAAFYDLFRVENGKLAEHWDTIEAIPPREEWKNQNGKFGF